MVFHFRVFEAITRSATAKQEADIRTKLVVYHIRYIGNVYRAGVCRDIKSAILFHGRETAAPQQPAFAARPPQYSANLFEQRHFGREKSTSIRSRGADKGSGGWSGIHDRTQHVKRCSPRNDGLSMEVPFPALPITHTSRWHNCSRRDYTADRRQGE